MAPGTIDLGVQIFGGFTEDTGEDTGMFRAYLEARKTSSSRVLIRPPDEWKANVAEIADWWKLVQPKRHVVIGYSWGGGWAVPRYVKRYSATIDALIMVDPVYRSRWLPWWLPFNPISMTRLFSVKIEGARVLRAIVFRQSATRPAGRRVVGADHVDEIWLNDTTHTTIDNDRAVRSVIAQTIKQLA